MMRRRTHPRAGARAIRHLRAAPAPVEDPPGLEDLPYLGPALDVSPPWVDADLEAAVEAAVDAAPAPPALRREQILRLEALTAIWAREVRVGGPMPDDTLLYGAPKPPPPPRPDRVEEGIRRAIDREVEAVSAPPPPVDLERPAPPPPPVKQENVPSGQLAGPPETGKSAVPGRVVRDWVSRHDPRSRSFDVAQALKGAVPLQDRLWAIGPVFDQGTTPPLSARDASGCVGMAVAAAANVQEIAATVENATLRGLLQKEDALALYARAQELDHVSGNAYAGTSVLAGMKAGQEAGLWDSYLWAFGTRPLAQALLRVGPVVIGIPWDTRLEDPDPDGRIRPGGEDAGGHCLALVGFLTSRPGGPWFVAQQSRGTAVGDGGLVYIHHRDLTALLRGRGEAAVPVPPGGLP